MKEHRLPISRRRYLALAGASTVGVAGCQGTSDEGESTPTETPADQEEDVADDETGTDQGVSDEESSTEDEGDSADDGTSDDSQTDDGSEDGTGEDDDDDGNEDSDGDDGSEDGTGENDDDDGNEDSDDDDGSEDGTGENDDSGNDDDEDDDGDGDDDEDDDGDGDENEDDDGDGDDDEDDDGDGDENEDDGLSEDEKSLAELSFEGEFFDTHAHWRMADSFNQEDFEVETLTDRQNEHDVGATVLFGFQSEFEEEYDETVATLATDDVDYLPFFVPKFEDGSVSLDSMREFYHQHEEIFYGLGEMVYYQGPLEGKDFTADPMPELYEFAAEEDLVLMFHPTEEQEDGVETMLSDYPETTLLLHGHELLGQNAPLFDYLREYDNLYWTYDTATMLGGLIVRASDKEEFIDKFEANRETYFRRATGALQGLVDAAPDRVMWGTDVFAKWNLEPEVYERLVTFSQEVIQEIPSEHRDGFASQNAIDLFDA